MENFSLSPTPQLPVSTELSQYEKELHQLKHSNTVLQNSVQTKESQLNKAKVQLGTIREERDRLRRRVLSVALCICEVTVTRTCYSFYMCIICNDRYVSYRLDCRAWML